MLSHKIERQVSKVELTVPCVQSAKNDAEHIQLAAMPRQLLQVAYLCTLQLCRSMYARIYTRHGVHYSVDCFLSYWLGCLPTFSFARFHLANLMATSRFGETTEHTAQRNLETRTRRSQARRHLRRCFLRGALYATSAYRDYGLAIFDRAPVTGHPAEVQLRNPSKITPTADTTSTIPTSQYLALGIGHRRT